MIRSNTTYTLVALVLALALTGCAYKTRFPASPVVPAAQASLKMSRDDNGNAMIRVRVKHLADPASLFPPRSVYVVWVQATDGRVVNLGALQVSKDLKGELWATTPLQEFRIVITAEDEPSVFMPSNQVVLVSELLEAR